MRDISIIGSNLFVCLSLRRPLDSSVSISTIPTVTANTVGTPVLTTVQSKGLPDWYGVITLRVHCGGTQHIQSIRI